MKPLSLVIVFLLSLFSGVATGQSRGTISGRLLRRDTGLFLVKRAESGKYIVAAALDKRKQVLYLLNRNGDTWDSLRMNSRACDSLTAGRLDPFRYYHEQQRTSIAIQNELIREFRSYGRLDSLSPLYRPVLQNFPEFKQTDSISVLRHILKVERQNLRDSVYAWGINAGDPKYFSSEQAYADQDHDAPGARYAKEDTLYLINADPLSKVNRAIIIRKEGRISYYNREGIQVVSFRLSPGELKSDFTKTDVFTNYLALLESGRMLLERQAAQLKQRSGGIRYAAISPDDKRLSETISRQQILEQKLAYATAPDLKALATRLRESDRQAPPNREWLSYLGMDDEVTNWDSTGNKRYELTNHLGNVLATITDKRTSGSGYYLPDLKSAQDYYGFGALMPGRMLLTQDYRYGFNGKENDNEIKGLGNQQNYGKRIYDPRIGKFFSIDPLVVKYPELTPYQFASNTPIQAIDVDGTERFNLDVLRDKNGNAYLKYTGKEDIIDHSIQLSLNPPYILIIPEVNKRQEFVIHGTTTRYIDNMGHNTFYEDKDDETFNTLDDAQAYVKKNNGIAFNAYSFSHQLMQGIFYVAEEKRTSGYQRTTLPGEAFGERNAPTETLSEPNAEVADVNIETAKWAQSDYSEYFGKKGAFKGQSITDVVSKLKTGQLLPSDVPIDVVVRDGNTLILNTRSSVALTRAGIPRSQWSIINRTGQPFYENNLNNQLIRSNLDNSGTKNINSRSKSAPTNDSGD